MAIEGAPDDVITAGGSYSSGPAEGVYHVVVQEAARGESKSSSRPQLIIDLFGKDDQDHPAKQGKRVTKMYQSLSMKSDTKEKADTMRGMFKRLVFDGFGLKWPADDKPFDVRSLQGKEAWILIAPRKDDRDGSMRNQVVAIAQDKAKLPKLSGASTTPPAGGVRRVRGGRNATNAAPA